MADNKRKQARVTAELVRRHEVFVASAFNRDMLRAESLIERLRIVLDRLVASGPDDILTAWRKAGLPEHDGKCPYAESWLRVTEVVPGEASGFLWACNAFLGTLVAQSVSSPRAARRQDRALAREYANRTEGA